MSNGHRAHLGLLFGGTLIGISFFTLALQLSAVSARQLQSASSSFYIAASPSPSVSITPTPSTTQSPTPTVTTSPTPTPSVTTSPSPTPSPTTSASPITSATPNTTSPTPTPKPSVVSPSPSPTASKTPETAVRQLIISNIRISNITHESATISWSTNFISEGYIWYGTIDTADGRSFKMPCCGENTPFGTQHSVELSGLSSDTRYFYRIGSRSNTDPLLFNEMPSLSLITLSEPSLSVDFIRGDVNQDGNVDLADTVHLSGWLLQGTEDVTCLDAADVNDDGLNTSADIAWILDFLHNGGPAPKQPFPAGGFDLTSDDLTCESYEVHRDTITYIQNQIIGQGYTLNNNQFIKSSDSSAVYVVVDENLENGFNNAILRPIMHGSVLENYQIVSSEITVFSSAVMQRILADIRHGHGIGHNSWPPVGSLVKMQGDSSIFLATLDSQGSPDFRHIETMEEVRQISPRGIYWEHRNPILNTNVQGSAFQASAFKQKSESFHITANEGGEISWDSEFIGFGYNPKIVQGENGYGIVWSSKELQDGEVYFAVLNENGEKITANIRVSKGNLSAGEPSISWGGNAYAIAWTEKDPGTVYFKIHFIAMSNTGQALTSERLVGRGNESGQEYVPRIFYLDDIDQYGLFYLSTSFSQNGQTEMLYTRLTRIGLKAYQEIRIRGSVSGYDVTHFDDGYFGIVYTSRNGEVYDLISTRMHQSSNGELFQTTLIRGNNLAYYPDPQITHADDGIYYVTYYEPSVEGQVVTGLNRLYTSQNFGPGEILPSSNLAFESARLAWNGSNAFGSVLSQNAGEGINLIFSTRDKDGNIIGDYSVLEGAGSSRDSEIIHDSENYLITWEKHIPFGTPPEIMVAKSSRENMPEQISGFRRGDANDDAEVDVSDMSRILNWLFLGSEEVSCFDAADVNDDSTVNITDPLYIKGWLFLGEVDEPPLPGPFVPGPDPTEDDLNCGEYNSVSEVLPVQVSESSMASFERAIGQTNALLGRFFIEAPSEDINIRSFDLGVRLTVANPGRSVNEYLQNIKVYSMVQGTLAGPVDPVAATLGPNDGIAHFNSVFTIPAGQKYEFEIYGDFDSPYLSHGDSIQMSILPTTMVAETVDGGQRLDISPQTEIVLPAISLVDGRLRVEAAAAASIPSPVSVYNFDTMIGGFYLNVRGEAVRINELHLRLHQEFASGKIPGNIVSNLFVKDSSGNTSYLGNFSFLGTNFADIIVPLKKPLIITPSSGIRIDVFARPNDLIIEDGDSIQVGFRPTTPVYRISSGNRTEVTPNEVVLSPQVSFLVSNILHVDRSSNSLPSRIIIAGSQAETMAELRLRSTGNSIDIVSLPVVIQNGGVLGTHNDTSPQDNIDKFWLKRDGVVIGNISGYVLDSQIRSIYLGRGVLTVPEGETGVTLSIIASINDIGTNLPGESNVSLKMGISGNVNHIQAVENSLNTSVAAYFAESMGFPVVLHKGAPQIELVSPRNILGTTNTVLHTARITALGNNIGIYKTSYQIFPSTGVDIRSIFTRLTSCNGCEIPNNTQLSLDKATRTPEIIDGNVTLSFNITNHQHGKQFLLVNEGATAQVDLIGAQLGLTPNIDSIVTSLQGDERGPAENITTGSSIYDAALKAHGNFIWSDLLLNSDSQSYDAITAAQWFNGYLVDGLKDNTSTPIIVSEVSNNRIIINRDASSKPSRIVLAGTQSEPMADLRIKSRGESSDITRLAVNAGYGSIVGAHRDLGGAQENIDKIWLKREGVVIGNTAGYAFPLPQNIINLDRGVLTIPEGDTGIVLSVIASLNDIGTNFSGESNVSFEIGLSHRLENSSAVGNQTNEISPITMSNTSGTPVVLHKGAPQVVIVPPTNILAATSVLHTARVTAIGHNIGLYKTSYWVNTSTRLFVTNAFTRLTTCNGCGGIANGSQLSDTELAFFRNSDAVFSLEVSPSQVHGKRYLAVSEGATAQIDIVASVQNMTINTDSVSTALLGDFGSSTNELFGNPAPAFRTMRNGNFVWSDLLADESQTEASVNAKQWFNGYLVEGLGSTVSTTIMTVSD